MSSSPQLPQIQTIKVQLLLAGGHHCTLHLQSDSPLLQELFTSLANRSSAKFSQVFQIPINGGRSSLCLPSENLVGIVTQPPIFLQPAPPEPTNVLVSNYVQIDNFLSQEETHKLLTYTLAQESAFVTTSTTADTQADVNHRQSLVLYVFPEFAQLIASRLRTILPEILIKLGIPSFAIAEIESQLTAHNHGHYYKIHNDNGSLETATREVTYVYYFYQQPQPFSGGELLLYDTKIENNFYIKADSFQTVEPRHNSLVVFPSRYLHEVLPVSCPSQTFADSRFTINGWVRR